MRIAAALALAVLCLTPAAARAEEGAEQAARAAAEAWLQQVDAGRYGASWDGAARLFKDAIGRADWERALAGVRAPLGTLVTRQVVSATPATSLPGAPDGRYVVIQCRTTFANKKAAVETVTPTLEKDGRWRVSGYFIK